MDIIFYRNNANEPKTNVIQSIKRFNDPFEWGIFSNGAFELSLNILELFCDEFTREKLYKKFANDIISDVPFGGRIITENEIEAWIAANSQLEDKRNKSSFIVAVFKEETKENQIREVDAYTDIEAVIRACELDFEEDYIQSLIQKITDFDELYDYYSSREVWFSDPQPIEM